MICWCYLQIRVLIRDVVPESPPFIAQFELIREVRLVDTDSTGFAHFSSYVRMMEETEYAFLRSRGLRVVLYDERGTMGFPRLHVSINIFDPVSFGERVLVKLKLAELDGKQITYCFDICNQDGEVVVEGEFRAAFCRFPDGEPPFAILIPEFVTAALTAPSEVTTEVQV